MSIMITLIQQIENLKTTALAEDDFFSVMFYDQVVSFVNNCHQMGTKETVEYVESCVQDMNLTEYGDNAEKAYENTLSVLNSFHSDN